MAISAIAIVPAGGRSRRLGRLVGPGGKAALPLGGPRGDGPSLLAGVCGTLADELDRVIVVAAADQPLPDLPDTVAIIRDTRPAAGPLAAIGDGLRHARDTGTDPAAAVIIAACDLPRLAPAIVRLLRDAVAKDGVRWAVPLVAGHPQVLLSAMRAGMLVEIERLLAAGGASPRQLLASLGGPPAARLVEEALLRVADPGLESFADIDTPDDLARFEDHRAGPGWPNGPPSGG